MKDNKQTRKITIFAIFLSLISIGILVFGFLLVSSDKVVMMQSISNIYNEITEELDDSIEILNKIAISDNIGIKANITSDTTSLKLDYLENQKEKKSNLVINVNDGEDVLVDANFLLDNNKLYMFVKDITPTYYQTEIEYFNFLRSLSADDLESVLEIFKDCFKSSISKKDIKKEKVTIKYKGKDKKVNKLTYDISNNKLKDILDDFIKTVRKDKKLYGNIASSLDISKKELNDFLDGILDSIENNDNKVFSYSTYYYGFNRIVEYDFSIEDYTVKYKVEGSTSYIDVIKEGHNVLTVEEIEKKNKKSFKGSYTPEIDSDVIYNFEGVYSKNKLTLDISIDDNNYSLILKKKEDIKEDNYKYKFDVLIKENQEEIAKFKMNIEFYFNEKIDNDILEYKNLDELSEEEIDEITNNIMKLLPFEDELVDYYESD